LLRIKYRSSIEKKKYIFKTGVFLQPRYKENIIKQMKEDVKLSWERFLNPEFLRT